MSRITYHVADVVTGIVLDTLPLTGEVAKTRGQVESAAWEVPLPDERLPDNWQNLIQPGKNMIVAEWNGRPIQAWVIVSPSYGDPSLPLQGASLERLLERTYARNGTEPMEPVEWFNTDSAQILAELFGQVLVPEGGWSVQWTPTGTNTDAFYVLTEAKNLYTAAEDLEAEEGGPKWMCDVVWVPGEEGRRVEKVLVVGPTLGTERPEAIFTAKPGEYKRLVDWSGDNAALETWATTEGDGGVGFTETSYRSAKLDEGWHPNEAILSFADLDDTQLERRRDKRGRELEDGTISWEATLRIDSQPILNNEWWIGDTITLRALSGPYDPTGGTITSEAEGFVLNDVDGTITPRMVQEGTESSE